MHVVFRESHGLDETETPVDLGQTPADLVALSFSDSDLGSFAAGWHRSNGALPSLRLANLVALKHPLSVDTYVEQTLSGAKGILVRLIGGASYWPYGLAQLQDMARRNNIALAILPADGRDDPQLDELSTVPVSVLRRLRALCDAGGAVAGQAALAQLALAAGLYAGPVIGQKTVPDFGFYTPQSGVCGAPEHTDQPLVAVTLYRSYLTAADTAPIDALIRALRARGFQAIAIFVPSLKHPGAAAWIKQQLRTLAPAAIVNATAFSAQGRDGAPSPLNTANAPVFQVALSTARKKDWTIGERGLSPADLAMHVVLPEVDGRLFAGLVSFKSPGKKDPDLEYSQFAHRADQPLINAAADKVLAWYRLAQTPPPERRIAMVLSTYPGRDYNMAHAVGLDPLASTTAILGNLAAKGYDAPPPADLAKTLAKSSIQWPVKAYMGALDKLPEDLRDQLDRAWGPPDQDTAVVDGNFWYTGLHTGSALIALQPERGTVKAREDDYHDLSRTPRHSYVAFYLMLHTMGLHAHIHVGAHGTLEWLPGKSVALSTACWPEILSGPTPTIYPFIVNDPGEAAQAKRRIGAVTLGHLPPPMAQSQTPKGLSRLEQLLDEYSTADGLDPARRDRLIDAIRIEAQASGVEHDLGLREDASAAEAITRIDRFVCDIKESQFGDGLHIFGTGECGAAEMAGLHAALSGARVDAGPSGSPFRGRSDVMPTGRNLFTTDPRAVPSRAAHAQGVKLAEELLRRHLQDHGDWPKGLVVDLWGSATMRTAGEEFAMALHLAGLKPTWDDGSERVSGFEVIPLTLLNRPRIDVTLRVSGLFRDVFPGLAQMFESATAALAERGEDRADNPYAAATPRVFGPKPGQYGLAMGDALDTYSDAARHQAGEAWLSASEWVIDAKGDTHRNRAALEIRLQNADAFVHVQDLPETDVLLAQDYASHEAGFAAALATLGHAAPALYHVDSTRHDQPHARTLPQEIARVVRARAANPDWADGMMRHGFRGAAEIAATLDNMAAFAHLAQVVPAHLFDLYFNATLGRADLVGFMARENPMALAAMRSRFAALQNAGLWNTRRNSIASQLADAR